MEKTWNDSSSASGSSKIKVLQDKNQNVPEQKILKVPKALRAELSQLADEIELLQQNIVIKQNHLTKIKEQLSEEIENLPSEYELNTTLESLKEQNLEIQELTGISFNTFTEDILNEGDDKITKGYNISGTFEEEFAFKLSFETEEVREEDKSKLEISGLSIEIPAFLTQELQAPLNRIVDDQSVQGFFKLVSHFCRWHKHRFDLFDHFCKKYPDYVAVMEPESLVISHPKFKHSPVMTISWEIHEASLDRAVPQIRLGVEVSQEVVKIDQNKALEQAPENFQELIREYGIEKAVDIIINIICEQT